MFNNYKEQFQQQETRIKENQREMPTVYVGWARTLVLGINPDQEQLNEIIGDVAEKFDTKYQTTPDQYKDNKLSRPITFWLSDLDRKVSPVIKTIRLIDSPRLSKEGKLQYWSMMRGSNENGSWSILTTKWSNDVKPGDARLSKTSRNPYTEEILFPVRYGEEQYYNLLKKIIKFPDDEQFLNALKEEKLDFDTVYNGNFEGLHNLVNWINETKALEDGTEVEDYKTFIGIFTAKIKDDGVVRQDFSMREETQFVDNYGVLTTGMRAAIEKASEEALERTAIDIIREAYTLDPLVEYSEDVVKKEVQAPDVDSWFE